MSDPAAAVTFSLEAVDPRILHLNPPTQELPYGLPLHDAGRLRRRRGRDDRRVRRRPARAGGARRQGDERDRLAQDAAADGDDRHVHGRSDHVRRRRRGHAHRPPAAGDHEDVHAAGEDAAERLAANGALPAERLHRDAGDAEREERAAGRRAAGRLRRADADGADRRRARRGEARDEVHGARHLVPAGLRRAPARADLGALPGVVRHGLDRPRPAHRRLDLPRHGVGRHRQAHLLHAEGAGTMVDPLRGDRRAARPVAARVERDGCERQPVVRPRQLAQHLHRRHELGAGDRDRAGVRRRDGDRRRRQRRAAGGARRRPDPHPPGRALADDRRHRRAAARRVAGLRRLRPADVHLHGRAAGAVRPEGAAPGRDEPRRARHAAVHPLAGDPGARARRDARAERLLGRLAAALDRAGDPRPRRRPAAAAQARRRIGGRAGVAGGHDAGGRRRRHRLARERRARLPHRRPRAAVPQRPTAVGTDVPQPAAQLRPARPRLDARPRRLPRHRRLLEPGALAAGQRPLRRLHDRLAAARPARAPLRRAVEPGRHRRREPVRLPRRAPQRAALQRRRLAALRQGPARQQDALRLRRRGPARHDHRRPRPLDPVRLLARRRRRGGRAGRAPEEDHRPRGPRRRVRVLRGERPERADRLPEEGDPAGVADLRERRDRQGLQAQRDLRLRDEPGQPARREAAPRPGQRGPRLARQPLRRRRPRPGAGLRPRPVGQGEDLLLRVRGRPAGPGPGAGDPADDDRDRPRRQRPGARVRRVRDGERGDAAEDHRAGGRRRPRLDVPPQRRRPAGRDEDARRPGGALDVPGRQDAAAQPRQPARAPRRGGRRAGARLVVGVRELRRLQLRRAVLPAGGERHRGGLGALRDDLLVQPPGRDRADLAAARAAPLDAKGRDLRRPRALGRHPGDRGARLQLVRAAAPVAGPGRRRHRVPVLLGAGSDRSLVAAERRRRRAARGGRARRRRRRRREPDEPVARGVPPGGDDAGRAAEDVVLLRQDTATSRGSRIRSARSRASRTTCSGRTR